MLPLPSPISPAKDQEGLGLPPMGDLPFCRVPLATRGSWERDCVSDCFGLLLTK